MKYRQAVLIILLILIVDQVSKIYVKTHFQYDEEVMVLGTWFRLHFLENEGMAFGMKFSEHSFGKLALTLFRLIAVVCGFFVLKSLVKKKYTKGAIVCGALILAGALGNLIDSIFYGMIFTESSYHVASLVPFGQGYGSLFHGKVVDMLYFPMVNTFLPHWLPIIGGKHFTFFDPVFNLADMAISTGIITLLVFQKRFLGIDQKNKTIATEKSEQ